MDKKIQTILDYAKRLTEENLVSENDYIALRVDNKDMYITRANLDGITEEGVVREDYTKSDNAAAAIFNIYDVNAIIYAHPEKCRAVAKSGKTIVAPLDDMAQIVGYKCKVVPNSIKEIIPAMKSANSILIKDDGALTSGRTLDEAFTCLRVLEKSARVTIAGTVLGGCRKIGFLDAKLMRFVYKMKYSKQNQKNKASEEV